MKLVSYGAYGRERAGVLVNGRIIDVNRVNPDLPSTVIGLLERDALGAAEEAASAAGVPLDSVRLGAPLPRPSKIVCVGLNYRDHAEEQGVALPEKPLLFSKASSSVIGPYDDVVLPADSRQVDYEVEFAIVIGRMVTGVPVDDAYGCIAGYTATNDVSARDVQFAQKQWHQGKSYDTFCPMGPCLVTKDEIPDAHDVRVSLKLNGETLQDSNTNQLIFDVPTLVSRISHIMTLYPGDVISTGTPSGVGVFRDPKIFLKPGDVMETIVHGVGTLRNTIRQAH